MKEIVVKEIKPNEYEFGFRIQKLDIELMINLGLNVPNKLKEIYGKGFNKEELPEYIYINDPISVEFIKRQYYIRNYREFANLNLYELELLLNIYTKRFQNITNMINEARNKEEIDNLKVDLNVLINEILSIEYLKKEKELNNKRK